MTKQTVPTTVTLPICPVCAGNIIYKDGIYYTNDGLEKQRWLCRSCDKRFTIPTRLNVGKSTSCFTQISAHGVAKNLVKENPQTKGNNINLQVVGDVSNQPLINPIQGHLQYLKNNGYQPSTIERRMNCLNRLIALGANLADPESVKQIIAEQTRWKASNKQVVVFAYDLYAKQYGIQWQRPWYNAVRELPFIPQEREIDDLIAGCSQEPSLLLQIAKESGARAGEIYGLYWTDIDFVDRTLSIRAEKNSNPRRFKMSLKLQNMLECLPKKTEYIFTHYDSLKNLRRQFQRERKKLALKLCNPRLTQIKIHTLRHWKGTSEYAKTKDILHVMQTLGHKNIKNTLLYTQLVPVSEDKGFICKIASTPAEAVQLIEDGFELHCSYGEHNETKLFRKRKL